MGRAATSGARGLREAARASLGWSATVTNDPFAFIAGGLTAQPNCKSMASESIPWSQ